MLRAVSEAVTDYAGAAEIFQDLRDTLHEFRRTHGFGRGISAVQIGEPKRLIYIEFDGKAYAIRNPEYEFASVAKFRMWDDCFSFPNLLVRLERHMEVAVRYVDENDRMRRLNAAGALSELLQHEIDHLDGTLAVDRALDRDSFCTRDEWERRYRSVGMTA
jgi:peptide deformylase